MLCFAGKPIASKICGPNPTRGSQIPEAAAQYFPGVHGCFPTSYGVWGSSWKIGRSSCGAA